MDQNAIIDAEVTLEPAGDGVGLWCLMSTMQAPPASVLTGGVVGGPAGAKVPDT